MTGKQFGQLLVDRWYIVLALILIIGGLIWWAVESGRSGKIEDLNANINQLKGVNAVVTNQKIEVQNEVNQAANISNQAAANFNQSVNRDSSEFTGNSTDRFCARFCRDSTCVEWRKQNPGKCP